MNATDLKINDIVTYHHDVVIILGVSETFAKIQFQDGDTLTVPLEEIKSCEIFKKHLKSNHFYEHKEKQYVKSIATDNLDDNRRIRLNMESDCIGVYLEIITGFGSLSVFIADIHYMHELQHIISIFNVEISL